MVDILLHPVITCQDDGTVVIKLGEHTGYVSSFHLIEPKLNQLKAVQLRQVTENCVEMNFNDQD